MRCGHEIMLMTAQPPGFTRISLGSPHAEFFYQTRLSPDPGFRRTPQSFRLQTVPAYSLAPFLDGMFLPVICLHDCRITPETPSWFIPVLPPPYVSPPKCRQIFGPKHLLSRPVAHNPPALALYVGVGLDAWNCADVKLVSKSLWWYRNPD